MTLKEFNFKKLKILFLMNILLGPGFYCTPWMFYCGIISIPV